MVKRGERAAGSTTPKGLNADTECALAHYPYMVKTFFQRRTMYAHLRIDRLTTQALNNDVIYAQVRITAPSFSNNYIAVVVTT